MAYDRERARVVLFGGGAGDAAASLAGTWEWNGTAWLETISPLAPPAVSYPAMAYDSARGAVVLFGGQGSAGVLADTWAYGPLATFGDSGFHDPADKSRYSWSPQSGVTEYEARRSGSPQFAPPCTGLTTTDTFWSDPEVPDVGAGFYYLNRPFAPQPGSWGWDSEGNERSVCP